MKRYFFIALATFILTGIDAAHADFTNELIARWTFNTTDEKCLTDDIANLTFDEAGTGANQTTTKNEDGSVTLGSGRMLLCSALNSTEKAELKSGLTLWARIRLDEAPAEVMLMGLLDAENPADWAEQTLVMMNKQATKDNAGGLAMYGHLASQKGIGNASEFKAVTVGQYADVALIFDGKEHKVQLYVNGILVERKFAKTESELFAFKGLALGRLKKHAGVKMTIDELRVYRVPLPAEWLKEIEPVATAPEDSSEK